VGGVSFGRGYSSLFWSAVLRTLLIDDHVLFRHGLKFLLSDLDKSIEFVEAGSCEMALELPNKDAIDLVLLDLYMPGVNGLNALGAIKQAFESCAVVVLSSEDDPQVIRQAIEDGASGFVPKSSTPEVLIAALRLILAGGVYLPPHTLRDISSPAHGGFEFPKDKAKRPLENLSDRQLEVLLKAVQGKANKVIAREMKLSEGTVKAHLSASFRALGVQNRTEAVFVAAKLGLAQPGSNPG
jgi:DNA-binding NarL/FixJ family response regulator